jgi:hypothetical protein
MKTAGTFFCWAGCGNEGVWTIDEGQDYPRLSWEGRPGQPLPVQQLSDFLTGSGTAANPYRIYTAEQLNSIGAFSCEWDKHFILTADIDLSGYTGTQFNIIGYYMSYSDNKLFTGVFNGAGHIISNFTYTAADIDYIGLFGYAGSGALIKDLTLVAPDVNAAGDSDYVGSLVGCLASGSITDCNIEGGNLMGYDLAGGMVGQNIGTIENCYSSASVSGYDKTGGLVGGNYGTISNSWGTGSVTGRYYTGGLAGYNGHGTISNCYAAAGVTGTNYTGGLVGYNERGTISNCLAAGSVSGGDRTGGLAGVNFNGTISNCYATTSVTGHSYTGGLVGRNYGWILNCYAEGSVSGYNQTGGLVGLNDYGTISNCYAASNVSGTDYTGGLVGYNYSDYYDRIENCYAAGSVTGHSYTGGLVGKNSSGKISACFWDKETTDQPGSDGGAPKTTAQMQTMSTFTSAGWDFYTPVWKICEGTNYPKLVWQIPAGDFLCPDGVNLIDYSFFAGHWLDDNCAGSDDCDGADLDLSGVVDFNDIEIFAGNWLAGVE